MSTSTPTTTSASAGALSRAVLAGLPAHTRPLVDPADLRPRQLHLGLGAFHRAHQAVYTEAAAAASGQPWGIAAVAPRSWDTVAALRAQDGLWSVTDLRATGAVARVVGSVVETLGLGRDSARVDALLADPEVTVVTTTITEKGHHRRADNGALDTADPAVAADLVAASAGEVAVTVVGRLATGLARRMRTSGAPVSVVSCDNLVDNGDALARVVRDFVAATGWPDRETLLDFLDEAVSFPVTIVDRIVPAPGAAARARAAALLGVADAAAVAAEPYRRWVLQDRFAAARPPWELDGAEIVDDVRPHQLTKLRLLNGAHSALAHLGSALGCTTVAEAMATGWGEPIVRALAREVAPTLPPGGPDPDAYADELVARFANPAVEHRLSQIATDASLKIPQRWFAPLREVRHTPVLRLALAGWVHTTSPSHSRGAGDPAAARLARCWGAGRPDEVVRSLLREVGAPDLADDPALVGDVVTALPALAAGHLEP